MQLAFFAVLPYFLIHTKIEEKSSMENPDSEMMTIRELGTYLKMPEKTLYRLAGEGKVPGFKVGASWRFRKSEIDRWIKRQEKTKV